MRVDLSDLMDENLVKQGMLGYKNEIVMPEDSILEVDGVPAEHIPVQTLHGLLGGVMYTTCQIVLARQFTFDRYQVCVMRHREREFDVPYAHGKNKSPAMSSPRQISPAPSPVVQRASAPRTQRSARPITHETHEALVRKTMAQNGNSLSNFTWIPAWDNLRDDEKVCPHFPNIHA